MEPLEGKMPGTPSSDKRLNETTADSGAGEAERRGMALTTLAHHIDVDWLREAYRRTRKDGAAGVDGQTAEEYAANLEENLRSLLDRVKSGTYRAPPVRRVHIPKGDGRRRGPSASRPSRTRSCRRAVAMVLEAVYEQDFLDCSYGFRPGRSAHQALEALWQTTDGDGGRVGPRGRHPKFFDTLDHGHLRELPRPEGA